MSIISSALDIVLWKLLNIIDQRKGGNVMIHEQVSYCMVCAYVREGNPRALASGLSPVHTHNHTITALLHQHDAWAVCAL